MEKSTPHRKLSAVKALVKAGKVRSTVSALAGGAALGFDFDGIVGVVMALVPADFHKSRRRMRIIGFGGTCTGPPRRPERFI